MKNPKISVVFTSYNHKEYLRQALDSLLAQTFKDFELIIVDDCSTDGSQMILKEYAKKDNRIHLTLNTINSGSYVHSTNQGALLATAPYIIFAQCDDYAEPIQFDRLYKAITFNKVDVAFSCSKMVDENSSCIGTDFSYRDYSFRKKYKNGGLIKKSDAFKYLINSCIIPNLSAAIISRELYNALKGLSSEYLVLADWDFWIRLSKYSDFYYISQPLNNFRQHCNTIRETVKMTRQWEERFKMCKSVIDIQPEYKTYITDKLVLAWISSLHNNYSIWYESKSEIMKMGKEFSDDWVSCVIKTCFKIPYYFLFNKIIKHM